MMKKGMIRFLAAGMTAFTIGTTTALVPVTQVFADEEVSASVISDRTRTAKSMYAVEYEEYMKELVGDTEPFKVYDNCKSYKIGDKIYEISKYDSEEPVDKIFDCYCDAEEYFNECCKKGMKNGVFDDSDYYYTLDGAVIYNSVTVTGTIPRVSLSILTYTPNPAKTVKISAEKTKIRPGDSVGLQMHINEGADEDSVTWRFVGEEGVADFASLGKDAYVFGHATGSVMVVAETEEGVRDYIWIDIVDF